MQDGISVASPALAVSHLGMYTVECGEECGMLCNVCMSSIHPGRKQVEGPDFKRTSMSDRDDSVAGHDPHHVGAWLAYACMHAI